MFSSGEYCCFAEDTDKVETYRFGEEKGHHHGGDSNLVNNFIKVMKNEEPSLSPLSDGIASAALCLAAKKSADEHRFIEL